MTSSHKVFGITAIIALIIGFCVGFIPEHIKVSNQQNKIAGLTADGVGTQGQLSQAQNELALDRLTIEAALVSADAERNNYSVASSGASQLFTGLRQYADQTQDQQMKQQFEQILGIRDRTIAALAKADPAVKPLLQEIFRKLHDVEAHAK